jgi:hypothetical protein
MDLSFEVMVEVIHLNNSDAQLGGEIDRLNQDRQMLSGLKMMAIAHHVALQL